MKKPEIHKKLSEKEILKRHQANPKDKDLHKVIEGKGNDDLKEEFNTLLKKAAKPLKP